MYIIRINSYHPDSSACNLKDGKQITVIKKEKFIRIFKINEIK